MPIYDYSCTVCRHLVEVIHGINEAGPRFCPNCGVEGSMRKGFSTPAVHFKGSGWAKKDRSTSSSTRTNSTKSSSGGDGAVTGSTGGETAGVENARGDRAGSKPSDADSSSPKPNVAPATTASDGGS